MNIIETASSGVFLGLCLDEEMIRAEFEAIIAAEYPEPRRRQPVVACCHGRKGAPRPLGRVSGGLLVDPTGPADTERAGRQRSPPVSRAVLSHTKGGAESRRARITADH